MTGTTAELGLPTGQDTDDLEVYLTSNPGGLVAALAIVDALFNAATGHAHGGPHQGAPILTAGIANASVTLAKIAAEAWTAFTPTLSQGVAITLTTAGGRYVQLGKTILAQVDLVIGSAGTAGNAFFVGGLPNMKAPVGGYVVGHGRYLVGAGSRYPVELLWATATTVALQATDSVYTNVFGIAPAVTAGNTDQLALSFMYEAP